MRSVLVLVLFLVGTFTGGCQQPLFPTRLDRTQFDDHDRLRGEYVPANEYDVYGREQPALRARLNRR